MVHRPIPANDEVVITIHGMAAVIVFIVWLLHSPSHSFLDPFFTVLILALGWVLSLACQHLTQQLMVYAMSGAFVYNVIDALQQGKDPDLGIYGIAPLGLIFGTAIILTIFRAVPAGTPRPNDSLNPEVRESVMNYNPYDNVGRK